MSGEAPEVLIGLLRLLAGQLAEIPGLGLEPGEFTKRNKARYDIVDSALQTLTGFWLPETYEKHFNREAGRSREVADGMLGGPYIRFAREVLAVLRVSCSDETIAAAVTLRRRAREKN